MTPSLLSTPPRQVMALVDCNNFYASCERAFNPALKGHPLVVLSNNDGCIIARSQEAKRLGIAMGAPAYQFRALFQSGQVAVFSANFALYGDMSHRVMQTLRQFTPDMEVYSVDEAFLAFAHGTVSGQEIQQTVRRWTGIPVSVGIAETKTLAKIATEIAKTSAKTQGVLDLTASRHQSLALSRVAIEDVWGVGRRYAKRLRAAGIDTALHLRDADDDWLLRQFPVPLLRTVWELRGLPCIPLEQEPPPRKSIVCSRSFGSPIGTLAPLEQAVASYTARAAEKLRAGGLSATGLGVFIETNRFRPHLPQYAQSLSTALPVATDQTPELIQAALRLLSQIYRPHYDFHKAGVMLLVLVPASGFQQNLFDFQDRERSRRLMQTLDAVNTDFGSGTLRYAVEGLEKRWKMKQEQKSPRYTTAWSDLPIAHT